MTLDALSNSSHRDDAPFSLAGLAPALPELLWNERSVQSFDGLQRIAIPLVGARADQGLAWHLNHALHQRWVVRGTLPSVVTSVAVEVVALPLAPTELVLAVGTPPGSPALDGPTMIRDLRRALRDYRLSWPPAGPRPTASACTGLHRSTTAN